MKRIYFERILNGSKKNEVRELRPKSSSRYIEEKEELTVPKQYDLLRLYLGYQTNRPYFDVEVLNSRIYILLDENDNEITYIENDIEYLRAEIEYALGKIVFKYNC